MCQARGTAAIYLYVSRRPGVEWQGYSVRAETRVVPLPRSHAGESGQRAGGRASRSMFFFFFLGLIVFV